MAKKNIIQAEQGQSTDKRYGCPFTTAALNRACDATDIGSTEMEKMLKISFRQAKTGGGPVNVYGAVNLTKGPKGKTAHISIA